MPEKQTSFDAFEKRELSLRTSIRGRVIYQRKKNETSVLLLSLGFEKKKVRFWATYDDRIYFPVFFVFISGVRTSGSGLVQGL